LRGERHARLARAADRRVARAAGQVDGEGTDAAAARSPPPHGVAGDAAGDRIPGRARRRHPRRIRQHGAALMAAQKLLTGDWDKPESWTLDTYRQGGGYQALPKALKMQPQQIVD